MHENRHCEENYEVIDEAIQLKMLIFSIFLIFFWIATLLLVARNDEICIPNPSQILSFIY
ncbi:hypothetical protein [Rickettsia hoogstraalii]|uniref:hypothetical protein n=1 Tax=Rickettsia hoogstraalii TaxID=467174 RepID=UPI000A4479D1|nr:hypothetical protein [Rickettsia hoogstraalii]